MSHPLNLATRPFRNERLPRLLLGLAWLLALVLSGVHVLAARQLLPQSTVARFEETARLEAKLRRIAARSASSGPQASPEQLRLWAALKALVDRRAFSWTALLARLEQVVPDGVRIASLTPRQTRAGLVIEIEFVARTQEQSLDLLQALEAQPEFSEVYPLLVQDDEGLRSVRCTMIYDPDVPPAAPAAQVADGGQPR